MSVHPAPRYAVCQYDLQAVSEGWFLGHHVETAQGSRYLSGDSMPVDSSVIRRSTALIMATLVVASAAPLAATAHAATGGYWTADLEVTDHGGRCVE